MATMVINGGQSTTIYVNGHYLYWLLASSAACFGTAGRNFDGSWIFRDFESVSERSLLGKCAIRKQLNTIRSHNLSIDSRNPPLFVEV